jgi:transposase
MKRLERRRFAWPSGEDAVVSLTVQQLNYLLDGYNLWAWQPHPRLHFSAVA